MGEDKAHVPAIELWGYTNGTTELTDDYFGHLLLCLDCQSLMNEFMDVLAELPAVRPAQVA
jgi:hypothetical protein